MYAGWVRQALVRSKSQLEFREGKAADLPVLSNNRIRAQCEIVPKDGWLKKLGIIPRWKKKWLVLKDGVLFCFDSAVRATNADATASLLAAR